MTAQLAMLDSRGQPTLATAMLERDEAMERVLANAEKIKSDWGRVAYKFLVLFARTHQFFIAQDVVSAFKDQGYEQPHTDKAWGPITKRAIKVGCIEFNGFGKAPHRHASPCPRYRSKIFRGEM